MPRLFVENSSKRNLFKCKAIKIITLQDFFWLWLRRLVLGGGPTVAAANAHAAVCICSVVCNQGKMAFFPSGSVD